MPRAGRSFEEGRTYHVYNRVAGGLVPFADEDRALRRSGAHVDEQGRSTARWRPRYGARQWLDLTVSHLGAEPQALGGRGRSAELVWQWDLIGLVGIERYGVKVTELAAELGESRDGVSRWYRRGASRQLSDPEFAAAVEALDEAASEDP